MAITFLDKRKKLKILIPILIVSVLIIIIIIWQGFFVKDAVFFPEDASSFTFEKIKINFKALEDSFLEKMIIFEKIEPFKGDAGKKNPFSPLF